MDLNVKTEGNLNGANCFVYVDKIDNASTGRGDATLPVSLMVMEILQPKGRRALFLIFCLSWPSCPFCPFCP